MVEIVKRGAERWWWKKKVMEWKCLQNRDLRRGYEKSFNDDQNKNHDCQSHDDRNQVGL